MSGEAAAVRGSQPSGRVLGVDVGTVRVGLALSDPGGTVASPLGTLDVAAPPASRGKVDGARGQPDAGSTADDGWTRSVGVRLANVAREHGCEAVVVGLPRALSGRDTASTSLARSVADALEGELGGEGIAVVLWDERLSSVEAERALRAAGLRPQRRRAERDRVAAAIILQSWLDASRG